MQEMWWRLRTDAGVVDQRERGMRLLCTECFNLWLIIIWSHKGRCLGNSSACVECNLLCFSFPCGLKSGRSGDLTGVLGCLHVWYCGPSLLERLHNNKGTNGKDCTLQSYAEPSLLHTFFRGDELRVLASEYVLFDKEAIWHRINL